MVTFQLNKAQEHYHTNKWYRNLILKARQLGFTTYESVDSTDEVLFTPNMDALMIAHNLEAGESIFDKKISFAWEKFPEGLKDLWDVDANTTKTLKFGFCKDKVFSSIAVDTSGRSRTQYRSY